MTISWVRLSRGSSEERGVARWKRLKKELIDNQMYHLSNRARKQLREIKRNRQSRSRSPSQQGRGKLQSLRYERLSPFVTLDRPRRPKTNKQQNKNDKGVGLGKRLLLQYINQEIGPYMRQSQRISFHRQPSAIRTLSQNKTITRCFNISLPKQESLSQIDSTENAPVQLLTAANKPNRLTPQASSRPYKVTVNGNTMPSKQLKSVTMQDDDQLQQVKIQSKQIQNKFKANQSPKALVQTPSFPQQRRDQDSPLLLIWQKVQERINRLNLLVSYVSQFRKLMEKQYPAWIFSTYQIYRKFHSLRKKITNGLQDYEELSAVLELKISQQQLRSLQQTKSEQIKTLLGQDQIILNTIEKIGKLAKSRDPNKYSIVQSTKPQSINGQQIVQLCSQEINHLKNSKDQQVLTYLCKRVDSLLILLERKQFKVLDQESISMNPRKYLTNRIKMLNQYIK